MILDTTMLQSNTAISLVKYLTRQMKNITRMKNGQNMTETTYQDIKRDYDEIVDTHNKALRRRTGYFMYGYANKTKGE